jgi:hypothetical protein
MAVNTVKHRFLSWFFEHQKLVALVVVRMGSFLYVPLNNVFFFTGSYAGTILGGVLIRPLQFFV